MSGDAEFKDRGLQRYDRDLDRRRNEPGRQHAAAVVVMRDRSVIVTLGEAIMRVEPRGRRLVIMRMRDIMIVRVPDIGRKGDLMDARSRTRLVMRMIGHVLDFDLQMVTVIEHRPRKRRWSMIDLEDVLHPIEHDDRHLNRQRHAQSHAEHGDMAFGDCEALTDHNSSRRRYLELGSHYTRMAGPGTGLPVPPKPRLLHAN
jgi:hypothetical protein